MWRVAKVMYKEGGRCAVLQQEQHERRHTQRARVPKKSLLMIKSRINILSPKATSKRSQKKTGPVVKKKEKKVKRNKISFFEDSTMGQAWYIIGAWWQRVLLHSSKMVVPHTQAGGINRTVSHVTAMLRECVGGVA